MLLLGEAEDRSGKAADARKTFTDFIAQWPESKLKPEVDLAIARTYERENDWTNAINKLYAWVAVNTNHPALPQAEFQLAWADSKNTNDANASTKAYSEFTNFVATYTNELTPLAQMWIGDYHFGAGDFASAEVSFRGVFATNSPASPELQNEALMMAGRSAFARQGFSAAAGYFQVLATDSNCPMRLEAQFAWGDALKSSATQTNQAPCQLAITYFGDIATNYPNDPLSPQAWGRMGDCYRQLGAWGNTNLNFYVLASNAYANVLIASNADVATRSAAEYGIGLVLDKMARLTTATDPDREALLRQAVEHYLNIVNGSNLRDGEKVDLYWEQVAGLAAAGIEGEDLKEWDKVIDIYQTMQDDLPPLQGLLKRKIENAQKMLNATGAGLGQAN